MKRFLLLATVTLIIASSAAAHSPKEWRKMKSDVNIFLVSDLGHKGCYNQKVVAALMNDMAGKIKPQCIVATGDTHHGNGVKSIKDNDWEHNFEDIYYHPRLKKLDWYAAIGNHEYRGNSQALLEYSQVNPRWKITERYYTHVFTNKGTSIRFIFIDTAPLIDKYRKNPKYADSAKQDKSAQLQWLDQMLDQAKEDWVIVAGHHPIYAETDKNKTERENMQERVNSILCKHSNVDVYLSGHVHNFQHLRAKGCPIDYVINSSGAEGRKVKTIKQTRYCSGEAGFSVLSANKQELSIYMIDKNGNQLHRIHRTKR